MKKATAKLIVGMSLAVVATGLIIYARRRFKTNRINRQVADQGYETAYDILFPEKRKKAGRYKYGVAEAE